MNGGEEVGETGGSRAALAVTIIVLAFAAAGSGPPPVAGSVIDPVVGALAAPLALPTSPSPRPPTTSSRPAVSTTTTTRLLPPPPPARVVPLPADELAPVISRVPTADRVVFLTVDDGIVRDPAVLDHLAWHQLPFGVYLTKRYADQDPGFWRRAVAAGGTIQSHTITHRDLTRLGGAALRWEVCGTIEPYEALSGRRPTLFRPPYGLYNRAVRRLVAECGYRAVVLWKGATDDGRLALQEGALQPGDIILLHWRESLRADIDDIVAHCRREGLTIGRLEDYLG